MESLLVAVRKVCPGFVPSETTIYTLRYIFYSKSDSNPRFSIVSGLWSLHEKTFENALNDDSVLNCLAEYVCEYDSAFCGLVALLKTNEKEDVENA